MKICFIFLLTASVAGYCRAQESLEEVAELQLLLKERNDNFRDYLDAAGKKSGIFGNTTKQDLEQSREILLEIVQTDSRILSKIDQVISHRGMAKADYTLDLKSNEETIARLTQAADTLNKQLAEANEKIMSLQQKSRRTTFTYLLIVSGLAAVSVILLIRMKRR